MNEVGSGMVIAPMCIYRLAGMVLFSEAVKKTSDGYEFDMEKTAVLSIVQGPSGLGIQAVKGTESPYSLYASKMVVKADAIQAIQNTVNGDLVSAAIRAISGIILAKGPHR
jgi:hypothetical protein